MDARVLATFAERMRPRPSLVRTAAQQGLTDPVLRRRQLTMIVQAERDRCRRRADAERRRSLDEHLAWLEQEVARLEQAIARAVAALPDGATRAGRPYRAKTKGKVARPFRHIREGFFLARGARDLDDLNAQFRPWLDEAANVRTHATTRRVVAEHFAEHFAEERRASSRCPRGRSGRCCGWTGASPAGAWSPWTATGIRCPS